MGKPLAIDLYAGLGGWSEGLLAEGYEVIGFDVERHRYPKMVRNDDLAVKSSRPTGEGVKAWTTGHLEGHWIPQNGNQIDVDGAEWVEYPAQLVLQDVLTIHGSQFREASLIVASPPCQEFSYMAMPWTLAKEKQRYIEANPDERKRLTALFDACFRIQREAIEAAGHHIPLVVENVRGACKWVGRSRWNYGSFHLWGDVPALMPMTKRCADWSKGGGPTEGWTKFEEKPGPIYRGGSWFDKTKFSGPEGDRNRALSEGHKLPGFRFDGSGRSFQSQSVESSGVKVAATDGGRRTDVGKGARFTSRDCGIEGVKNGNDWFASGEDCSLQRRALSKSSARKAASALIAKIPLPLARYIANVYRPAA